MDKIFYRMFSTMHLHSAIRFITITLLFILQSTFHSVLSFKNSSFVLTLQTTHKPFPSPNSNTVRSLLIPTFPAIDDLPKPKPLIDSVLDAECSHWKNVILCSCYNYDEGLFIECSNTQIDQILDRMRKHQENSTQVSAIKSLNINNLNSEYKILTNQLFHESPSIQHLRFSFTSISNVSSEAFDEIGKSLQTLAIVHSKLQEIPRNSIMKLKNLASLDFEANEIKVIESYSFYGMSIVSLNLQSNQISELLEYSFAGLENTIEEMILNHNRLQQFPLIALRRLRKLRILKLQSNQITEIPDDGFTRFSILEVLDLQANKIVHLDAQSFITMPRLMTLSLSKNELNSIPTNSDIFIHLHDLESLDLSANRLQFVDVNNIHNLRTLDLSNNHLHSIELHNLYNLNELFLAHNNLLTIDNVTFVNTTQISILYLQHNVIQNLAFNALYSLPHLLTIDLSYNQLRAIHPNLFKFTDKLQSLYLDNNLLVDTGIEPGTFQELVDLREMRLQKNLLKRIRKGVFYSLPNLQELDLELNRIEMIESFESLNNLQHLNIQGNKLIETNEFLNKYSSNLRFLQLSNNMISIVHNNSLHGQKHLEVLWLSHNKILKLNENIFSDLQELRKLYLDHNEITSIETKTFSTLSKLIYLNLENNNLNHIPSNLFNALPHLEDLILSHSHITDIEANSFKSLKTLRTLDLSHNNIRKIKKNMFSGDLIIEHLKLNNLEIEKIESNAFLELKHLTHLDVSMNKLHRYNKDMNGRTLDDEIDFLFLPKLKYMDISGNNLTNFDEKPDIKKLFYSLSEIEYLDLSDTNLSIPEFKHMLEKIPEIKVLKFNGNSFGSLLNGFEINNTSFIIKKLEELYLENNQISDIKIVDHFEGMINLKKLSISHNSIKRLPKNSFKSLKNLKFLNISDNNISVLETEAFFNSSLERLDLSRNVIRTVGSDVFSEMNNLKSINLDNNWFQFMPNSLMSSLSLPKLKSLTLNHNPIVKMRESTVIIEEILPIEHLSLQYGNLSLIATHDFTGFFQLKELFISANKINKISPSAFRPLVNLKTLDLSQNVIEILPEERLSGLTSLRKLNLSMNELLELPHFKEDLQNLEILDLSFNRITRVEYEMTKLGASLLHISLNHNMIGSIAVNAFSNMTSLQTLDLSQNFLTFLSSDLFQSIEIRIKRIIISGNPFHCDCRMLSIYEWLEIHMSVVSNSDRDATICVQPEKLKDHSLSTLHPIDFCPMPQISTFEINQLESNKVNLKWDVQNDTLVGGFLLDYHLTSDRSAKTSNKNLPMNERLVDVKNLQPETWYTMCIQANGKYLRTSDAESSKPIPYVVDHQRIFGDFVTSNRKCIQVRTLSHSEKTPLSFATLGLIVSGIMSFVLVITVSILFAAYKFRRKRRRPVKNDIPEEYITYRHFSLPSSENVYS